MDGVREGERAGGREGWWCEGGREGQRERRMDGVRGRGPEGGKDGWCEGERARGREGWMV